MKLPCSVIQDLLPLYAEDLTSDVSKTLVEEHLPACEDCRKRLEELKAPPPALPPEAVPMQQVKKLLRKQLWLAVLLTVCLLFTFFIPFLYHAMQPHNMTYYDGLVSSIQENEDGSLDLVFAQPYSWLSASSIAGNDKTVDARGLQLGYIPKIYQFLHTNIGSYEAHISADFGAPDLLYFVNPDGEVTHLWGEIPEEFALDSQKPVFVFNQYLALSLVLFCLLGLLYVLLRKKKASIILGYCALFFLSYVLGHFFITGSFGPYYVLFLRHFLKLTYFILATTLALFGVFSTGLSLYRLRKDK